MDTSQELNEKQFADLTFKLERLQESSDQHSDWNNRSQKLQVVMLAVTVLILAVLIVGLVAA